MPQFYKTGKGGGTGSTPNRATWETFDIDEVFRRLRAPVTRIPKAAIFDLRDRGYSSPFEQIIGALIWARTRDETTIKVRLRLFEVARTPRQLLYLGKDELVGRFDGTAFTWTKARDHLAIARRIVEKRIVELPYGTDEVTSPRSVGSRIAALSLDVRFGRRAIAVEVQVLRIVNRSGYFSISTLENHIRPPDDPDPMLLDRDQRAPRSVRRVCLHRCPAKVLERLLAHPASPGRRDESYLNS